MKSQVHRLSAKALREQIKRGWTLVDFCTKYRCDETALRGRMRKILCNNDRVVNETFSQILANGKKISGKKGAALTEDKDVQRRVEEALGGVSSGVEVALGGVEDVQAGTETELETEAEAETGSEAEAEPEGAGETPRAGALREANKLLEELSELGETLKHEYYRADRAYSEACNGARGIEAEISRLEEELEKKRESLHAVMGQCNRLLSRRTEISDERARNLENQEEARRRIRELMAVSLIACDDGTIEAVDEPDFPMDDSGAGDSSGFTMDDSGAAELYTELVNDSLFEDFRAKEIRLLARALKIHENSTEREVKVVFENAALQEWFDSLASAPMGASTEASAGSSINTPPRAGSEETRA